MARKVTHQVARRGAESWEVYRVTWDGLVSESEIVGFVRLEGGSYRVWTPRWADDSYEWAQHPRLFQLPAGAIRALTSGALDARPS